MFFYFDTYRKGIRFEVYEEVTALAGLLRCSDIVALNKGCDYGLIIDPTIRLEINESQPLEVKEEKANIYSKTIPYCSEKYNVSKFEVYSILIGSRGTIPKNVQTF
jgi:hypothetical protein